MMELAKPELHFDREPAVQLTRRWDDIVQAVLEKVYRYFDASLPVQDSVSALHCLEAITAPILIERATESRLVVVSSVAGGGKSTIGAVLESMGFERLPRVTTRSARPEEVPGRDYDFVSREEFEKAKSDGEFVYAKETYGEGRAIRKSTLSRALVGNERFYSEGDALAYHAIRENVPGYEDLSYSSLFLVPDSFSTMLRRLHGRIQQDIELGANPEIALSDAEERIESALHYLEESGSHICDGIYDGYLVNDDLARVRRRLDELFVIDEVMAA